MVENNCDKTCFETFNFCLIFQVCLLSTSGIHGYKDLPHFRQETEKKDSGDGDHTMGNEAYRMPHPIW